MKRIVPAVVLNLGVPGTGLILLGREWVGLALAVGFGTAAELAAAGFLFAPAAVPTAAVVPAAALAAAVWGLAQILLVIRVRFLRNPRLSDELAALRSTAETSLARGDAQTACSALRAALSVDASDVAARVLWARLLTDAGQHRKARRAWRQAARLDRARRFETDIQRGLEQIGAT